MTVILVRVGAVLAVWAASTASAWPQIRNGTDLFGQAITPADLSPRGLPAVGAGAAAMGMGTLPIPRVSRRREGEGAAGFGKRRLLLGNLHQDHQQQGGEEDKEKRAASGSGFPSAPIQRPGLLTLPVVHVERPSLDKRGIETKLENRSDVAYYAQCMWIRSKPLPPHSARIMRELIRESEKEKGQKEKKKKTKREQSWPGKDADKIPVSK